MYVEDFFEFRNAGLDKNIILGQPPRQIADSIQATGMTENKIASKKGGGIAKRARKELEKKTGRKIVSKENFLPPLRKKKIRKK